MPYSRPRPSLAMHMVRAACGCALRTHSIKHADDLESSAVSSLLVQSSACNQVKSKAERSHAPDCWFCTAACVLYACSSGKPSSYSHLARCIMEKSEQWAVPPSCQQNAHACRRGCFRNDVWHNMPHGHCDAGGLGYFHRQCSADLSGIWICGHGVFVCKFE